MKKIIFILVILLLVAILGLRAYQGSKVQPTTSSLTEQIEATTPEASDITTVSPNVSTTPASEATPYDPSEVLEIENAGLDEETSQEILQTEAEWASEGTGVGQLTPAGDDSVMTQQTDEAVIEIGEGQSGSLGF